MVIHLLASMTFLPFWLSTTPIAMNKYLKFSTVTAMLNFESIRSVRIVTMILVLGSFLSEAQGQCANFYVTNPLHLSPDGVAGCSTPGWSEVMAATFTGMGCGSTPVGKTWHFKMTASGSSYCHVNANTSPAYQGTITIRAPYNNSMCGGSASCQEYATISYTNGWSDATGNIVVHQNNIGGDSGVFDGDDGAEVFEFKSIRTPHSSSGTMCLSYAVYNGKPVLEGDFGYWDWWNFVSRGKVIFFQKGCTDTNACNYESWAWEDDGSCNYTTCDCDDTNACNYANGGGHAGTCEYTSCDCNNSNACNYANGQGVAGTCEFTSCDCNNSNPAYTNGQGLSGATCEFTSCVTTIRMLATMRMAKE